MDRFLVALTLLLCSPWADAQLTGNSNGYDWVKHQLTSDALS